MNLELLFSLNNIAMIFWLMMIFLGWWHWTETIMRSPYVAIVPALIYVVLVLPNVGGIFAAVSNPTLEGITALLGTPEGAAIAWAHFIAFDLLVGRWAYLDSRARRIPWFLMSPVLFFTLMLGPVGFVLYLLLRALFAAVRRQPVTAVMDSPGVSSVGTAAAVRSH